MVRSLLYHISVKNVAWHEWVTARSGILCMIPFPPWVIYTRWANNNYANMQNLLLARSRFVLLILLLDSCRPNDIKNVQFRVRDCTNEVTHWCKSRRLQLNSEKTEAIWVGSLSNLTKLSGADRSLTVSSTTNQPTSVVRDLGILLDDELSMKQHVSKVAAICFYQLRRLLRSVVG